LKGEVIYIVSDARSGSTLVDQLLGAHPAIRTVGEIHHLVAYALRDRSRYDPAHPLKCSCGQDLRNCSFWSGIETGVGRPFDKLQIRPRFLDNTGPSALKRQARRLLHWSLQDSDSFLKRLARSILAVPSVARDNFSVFDAILKVADVRYVVDASKNTSRFQILSHAQPDRLRLILLCRDYRGVVYSKMKRGRSLEVSARRWVRTVGRMTALAKSMPDDRVHRIRYEDLCADPRRAMEALCEFLALPFTPDMLTRPQQDMHHIGGSPSKFEPERRSVRLDKSYAEAFSDAHISKLREIVGDAGKEWGYD